MSAVAAQYKKQDGSVSISSDGTTVWKSADGKQSLSVAVSELENLQQTPATSAKASVKLVVPKHAAGAYTLTFTSATARDDQASITNQLRKWVESCKAKSAPVPAASPAPAAASTPKAAHTNGGTSASMAMAQTATAEAKADGTYEDAKLLGDFELQMSLLNGNPMLRQRFDRALADRPESVTLGQFSNQFWSTRVHMLRSHATERSQTTAAYNVLSVVKPVNKGDRAELNITKEQIILIFKQHPVVRKAYNDLVPQMDESAFWERFYNSRLLKKLKGERIDDDRDRTDPKLDKYLNYDERSNETQGLMDSIPLFINIEGNEQNHSQKLGNRPDFTMNPSSNEKAPILRILNRMSEKIMERAPLSDTNRHGPSGIDEQTYKELQLRDLQRADDDNRVVLQVQDQSQFFSAGQSLQTSTSAAVYTKRTPFQTLSIVRGDFGGINPGQNASVNLHSTLGVNDEDSDSDEEDNTSREHKVGSKSSRTAATSQIMTAIQRRNLHDDDYIYNKSLPLSDQAKKLSLSESTLESLTMTHNTTVEFLHYFWAVFYSGDPDRANEVARLIETLDKSLDRIKAVADTAETERIAILERYKREVDAYNARSATKKRRYDPGNIKGGEKTISQIAEPLVRAIGKAREEYGKALQEQTKGALASSAIANA